MTFVGFGFATFLAFAVALGSARYLLPVPVSPSSLMIGHLAHWPWLVIIHVAGGMAALLLSLLQLVTRKKLRRVWHRHLGQMYVLACLSSAVAGFWLALHTTGGPIASVGFSGMAVAWFFATAQGWRKAINGTIDEHRRWMIRSVALTFSAVTLRILLPMLPLAGLSFDDAYRAVSFLCWIPQLLLVELWLRHGGWQRPPDRILSRRNPA